MLLLRAPLLGVLLLRALLLPARLTLPLQRPQQLLSALLLLPLQLLRALLRAWLALLHPRQQRRQWLPLRPRLLQRLQQSLPL